MEILTKTKKRNINKKQKSDFLLIFILFMIFSLAIFMSPGLNHEIYARSKELAPQAPASKDAPMPDYYLRMKQMEDDIKNKYDVNLLYNEPILPETTDPANVEIILPVERGVRTFMPDLGYANEFADRWMKHASAGGDRMDNQILHDVHGVLCTVRGLILVNTSPDGNRWNNYRGRFFSDTEQSIYDFTNSINVWDLSGQKREIIRREEADLQTPITTELVFGGNPNPSAIKYFNEMMEKSEIGYRWLEDEVEHINEKGELVKIKVGRLYVEGDDFDRLYDLLYSDDKYRAISRFLKDDLPYGYAPDYERANGNNEEYGFINEIRPPEIDFITAKEYYEVHGHDYENITYDTEQRLKTFETISGISFMWAGERTNPFTDTSELTTGRGSSNPNGLWKKKNPPNLSPQGAFLLARSKTQERLGDEVEVPDDNEEIANYTRATNYEYTPFLNQIGRSAYVTSLQVALWEVPEGEFGYEVIGFSEGAKNATLNYPKVYSAIGEKVRADGMIFHNYWVDFMSYIENQDLSQKTPDQIIEYVEYEDGKPIGGTGNPTRARKPRNIKMVSKDGNDIYKDIEVEATDIGYEPFFYKGAEETKDVEYNHETQQWVLGPYRIEYFKSKKSGFTTLDSGTYTMADVVGSRLVGRYKSFSEGGEYSGEETPFLSHLIGQIKENEYQNTEEVKHSLEKLNELGSVLNEVASIAENAGLIHEFNSIADITEKILNKISNGENVTETDINVLRNHSETLTRRLEEFGYMEEVIKISEATEEVLKSYNGKVEVSENTRKMQEKYKEVIPYGRTRQERASVEQAILALIADLDMNNKESTVFEAMQNMEQFLSIEEEAKEMVLGSLAYYQRRALSAIIALYNEISEGAEITNSKYNNMHEDIMTLIKFLNDSEQYGYFTFQQPTTPYYARVREKLEILNYLLDYLRDKDVNNYEEYREKFQEAEAKYYKYFYEKDEEIPEENTGGGEEVLTGRPDLRNEVVRDHPAEHDKIMDDGNTKESAAIMSGVSKSGMHPGVIENSLQYYIEEANEQPPFPINAEGEYKWEIHQRFAVMFEDAEILRYWEGTNNMPIIKKAGDVLQAEQTRPSTWVNAGMPNLGRGFGRGAMYPGSEGFRTRSTEPMGPNGIQKLYPSIAEFWSAAAVGLEPNKSGPRSARYYELKPAFINFIDSCIEHNYEIIEKCENEISEAYSRISMANSVLSNKESTASERAIARNTITKARETIKERTEQREKEIEYLEESLEIYPEFMEMIPQYEAIMSPYISLQNDIDKDNNSKINKEQIILSAMEVEMQKQQEKYKTVEKITINAEKENFMSEAPVQETAENTQNPSGGDPGGEEIRDIEKWDFMIPGRDPVEGQPYYPEPGEEFYYLIDYDPRLMDVLTASFDFGYIVYNGKVDYYIGAYVSIREYEGVVPGELEVVESTNEPGYFTVVPEQEVQPQLEAEVKAMRSQAVSTGTAAIWQEIVRITIHPNTGTDTNERINITRITPSEFTTPGTGLTPTPPITHPTTPSTPGTPPITPPPPPPSPDPIARLYVPIGGKVWLDKEEGEKHIATDHKYGANDSPMEDTKVDVYRVIVRANGDGPSTEITQIEKKERARLFEPGTFIKVDSNDIWTDAEGKWGPYDIHDIGFSEAEQAQYDPSTHRVIFEVNYKYNGFKYKPVLPLNMYESGQNIESARSSYLGDPVGFKDTSKAVEDPLLREEFNKQFAEIEGGTPLVEKGGIVSGTEHHANNHDRTESTELKYKIFEHPEAPGYEKAEIDIPKTARELLNDEELKKFVMEASTLNIAIPYPIHKNVHIPRESIMGGGEKTEVMENETIQWFNQGNIEFQSAEPYMKQIDMGLMEREKVNLLATKDLLSATLFVNRKGQAYQFGEGLDLQQGELYSEQPINLGGETAQTIDASTLAAEFEAKNHQDYILDLYKADYLYRTAMYGTKMDEEVNLGDKDLIREVFGGYSNFSEQLHKSIQEEMEKEAPDEAEEGRKDDTRQLDVYLTYKASVVNMSQVDNVYVTEIRDFYNPDYMVEVRKQAKKHIQKLKWETDEEKFKQDAITEQSEWVIPDPQLKVANFAEQTKLPMGEESHVSSTENDIFEWEGEEGRRAIPGTGDEIEDIENYGVFLRVGEKVDIYTTYRLQREALAEGGQVPDALTIVEEGQESGEDKILANVVEVGSFAVYDPYNGKPEGKIDNDSAPGNFDESQILGDTKIEDVRKEFDTGVAPGLKIKVKESDSDNSRSLDGFVWEDSRNQEIKIHDSATGATVPTANGIYEPGEIKLENQKVVLEERISVRADSPLGQKFVQAFQRTGDPNNIANGDYVDIPFVWPESVQTGIGTINLQSVIGLDSAQLTTSDGNYRFEGMPAGNYVVKVPYTSKLLSPGEVDLQPEEMVITKDNLVKTAYQPERTIKWINGIDFKSTPYRTGAFIDLNETWIPKERDGETDLSYIRDDEFRRMEIIYELHNTNNRLASALREFDRMDPDTDGISLAHWKGRMVATTPKLAFTVENIENQAVKPLEETIEELESSFISEHGIPILKGSGGPSGVEQVYPSYYEVTDINAGITQRPIAKMKLNKDIINVKVDTNAGDNIMDLKFITNYEIKDKNEEGNRVGVNAYEIGTADVEFSKEFNESSSKGFENVTILDNIYETRNSDGSYNVNNVSQGFVYLNLDEQMMQGSTITSKYEIIAVNLSEPDIIKEDINPRSPDLVNKSNAKIKGYYSGPVEGIDNSKKLYYEFDPDTYGFGHFLGTSYYEYKDEPVSIDEIDRIEFDEIIDYIDPNNSYAENAFTGLTKGNITGGNYTSARENENLEPRAQWKKATKRDLINKYHTLSVDIDKLGADFEQEVKKLIEDENTDIIDDDGNQYLTNEYSNVYVSTKTPEQTLPAVVDNTLCTDAWYIATERYIAALADSKDLVFENTAELLAYTTKSGKRVRNSLPGTLFTDEDKKNLELSDVEIENFFEEMQKRGASKKFARSILEHDASTTEKITVTPPTGLSLYDKNREFIIAGTTILLSVLALIGITSRHNYVKKEKLKRAKKQK